VIANLETWETTRVDGPTESERRRFRKIQPSPYALRGKLLDAMGVPFATDHTTEESLHTNSSTDDV